MYNPPKTCHMQRVRVIKRWRAEERYGLFPKECRRPFLAASLLWRFAARSVRLGHFLCFGKRAWRLENGFACKTRYLSVEICCFKTEFRLLRQSTTDYVNECLLGVVFVQCSLRLLLWECRNCVTFARKKCQTCQRRAFARAVLLKRQRVYCNHCRHLESADNSPLVKTRFPSFSFFLGTSCQI